MQAGRETAGRREDGGAVSGSHVSLSPSGPPETVLLREPFAAQRALEEALSRPGPQCRNALSEVVRRWPQFLEAWARLGEHARDTVEAYACFRVGYHRGLDRLRQSGWRGSGYVRWQHPENQGFLRSLAGLSSTAADLGEQDEAERCELFLHQLDPGWSPLHLRD